MRPRAAAGIAIVLASVAVLTGCTSPSPKPTATPVTTGIVPATTQEVVVVTPLACKDLSSSKATFAPLKVQGPGYSTTVQPTQGCKNHGAVSTLVYSVPMRASGAVTVTPGNQSGPKLNAALVAKQQGRTVYYGPPERDSQYSVLRLVAGNSENAG